MIVFLFWLIIQNIFNFIWISISFRYLKANKEMEALHKDNVVLDVIDDLPHELLNV